MKKINIKNEINKYYVIFGSIFVAIVTIILIFSIAKNNKQYLVQSGMLEYTEIITGYILKNESVISKDQTKVVIPIVSEGARVSKQDIIATYKGEEYSNYEAALNKMDREILEGMKDLPIVYSSEVEAIENTIYDLIKKSIGENSYSKMQEYRQKINSCINKRANIIGELSPDGAEIKELIRKRNQYEIEAKKSNDNILANMPGVVSYTTDGIEEKIDYANILNTDYNSIKSIVTEHRNSDNTKMKIVDNYEAYIVIKANKTSETYAKEGKKYTLRLVEQDGYELTGIVEKVSSLDDGVQVYFKITNGIENLVNLRETQIEVVWDAAIGLIIPKKALNKYYNTDTYYVNTIKYSQYINIPVAVRIENDGSVLVKNYTDEELERLGLICKHDLKLYDRIIVSNK